MVSPPVVWRGVKWGGAEGATIRQGRAQDIRNNARERITELRKKCEDSCLHRAASPFGTAFSARGGPRLVAPSCNGQRRATLPEHPDDRRADPVHEDPTIQSS